MPARAREERRKKGHAKGAKGPQQKQALEQTRLREGEAGAALWPCAGSGRGGCSGGGLCSAPSAPTTPPLAPSFTTAGGRAHLLARAFSARALPPRPPELRRTRPSKQQAWRRRLLAAGRRKGTAAIAAAWGVPAGGWPRAFRTRNTAPAPAVEPPVAQVAPGAPPLKFL